MASTAAVHKSMFPKLSLCWEWRYRDSDWST